ncbi:MAG TPA: M28 family peptidase [Coriobacteriia bacterium]|nr:M28 family peptidase [Coriobacteriia bacterium]
MSTAEKAAAYLRDLTAFPDRHVGGEGNRAATALFAEAMRSCGYEVRKTLFDCIEWEYGEASIEVGGEALLLNVGPYSMAVDERAPLAAVSTVEELEALGAASEPRVVLLHGEIASGQLMPKNFVWYNPDEHKRIYRALERVSPVAVLAATGRDASLVGSQYPFPLFEDGDFDVPNAYLTDVEGERLLAHAGEQAKVRIDSTRIPTVAEHVVALKPGRSAKRIVISAHIDSRKGSPGALDNASGVVTVVLLAEMLEGRSFEYTLEFVPFNGEDNYANPGEMLWAGENEGHFDEIALNVNIDDSGQRDSDNHVSFYGCPEEFTEVATAAMAGRARIAEGPQWFQGDHMIAVQAGRPALAVASSEMERFMAEYAHSERDTIELADPQLIADTAEYLADVIGRLPLL